MLVYIQICHFYTVSMGGRKFRLHRRKRYSHPPKPVNKSTALDNSDAEKTIRVRRRKAHSHPTQRPHLTVSLPRPPSNWESLCTDVKGADLGRWSYITTADKDTITLCKFTTSTPPTVYMTLNVTSLTPTCRNNWDLHVGLIRLPMSNLPGTIRSISDLCTVLNGVDKTTLCIGCSDEKFAPLIESRKGNFFDQYGEWSSEGYMHGFSLNVTITLGKKVAYYDEDHSTVRHVDCSLLLEGSVCCNHCKKYQKNTLNKLLHRMNNKSAADKENTSSHINHRFMDSESKTARIKALKLELQKKTKALRRMEGILQERIRNECVPVDDSLHDDLLAIMDKHITLEDEGDEQGMDFQKIFWKQQRQAFSKKCAKSVRWHPLIVKWCLYLHHKSSGAYETLRNSGLIRLPSGRTLRDYRWG